MIPTRIACVGLLASLSVVLAPPGQTVAQDTQPADYESRWFRNVRQLTSREMGLARSGEAYFSPDCRRISFQAYPVGKETYQIYVMNLDGSDLKMVSTGDGATTCSFFHPSGQKLIFAANHHDQRLPEKLEEVEQMRPRGGTGPEGGGQAAGHPGRHGGGHPGGQAGGHPHGHRDADRGAASGIAGRGRHRHAWVYYPGMEIYEYTFATGALKRLTFSEGYDAECTYSPDGEHIVFSSFRDGDLEIYICDADGANPRRITCAEGKDGGPFFSPDGKRVVYRSERHGDGNLQIFVNNTAGSDERAITDHDTFHWCPYWHPSGKWIIFTHADFRGRPNFDLYLLREDGSEMHRVTSDPAFDGLPVFSPDGRYVMWTSTRNGLDSPQIFIAEFLGLSPDGELRGGATLAEQATKPP